MLYLLLTIILGVLVFGSDFFFWAIRAGLILAAVGAGLFAIALGVSIAAA